MGEEAGAAGGGAAAAAAAAAAAEATTGFAVAPPPPVESPLATSNGSACDWDPALEATSSAASGPALETWSASASCGGGARGSSSGSENAEPFVLMSNAFCVKFILFGFLSFSSLEEAECALWRVSLASPAPAAGTPAAAGPKACGLSQCSSCWNRGRGRGQGSTYAVDG